MDADAMRCQKKQTEERATTVDKRGCEIIPVHLRSLTEAKRTSSTPTVWSPVVLVVKSRTWAERL